MDTGVIIGTGELPAFLESIRFMRQHSIIIGVPCAARSEKAREEMTPEDEALLREKLLEWFNQYREALEALEEIYAPKEKKEPKL